MSNRIRELRKAKNLTQKQLGVIIGAAESTVSQYENEKRQLDKETLIKLSMVFGETIGYILGVEEKSTPAEDGKGATSDDIKLTHEELNMFKMFRCLDDRGRAAVLNTLEHEYAALPQAVRAEDPVPKDRDHHILRVAARDGTYKEYILSDEQIEKLAAYLDSLPDVPDDL